MNEKININEWKNARQIYDAFGVSRSLLGDLAADGRVERRTIRGDFGVLHLYSVKDIERVIAGGEL